MTSPDQQPIIERSPWHDELVAQGPVLDAAGDVDVEHTLHGDSLERVRDEHYGAHRVRYERAAPKQVLGPAEEIVPDFTLRDDGIPEAERTISRGELLALRAAADAAVESQVERP